MRPEPGKETELPVLYHELELNAPLQMTLEMTTRRQLRADSNSWLCNCNPNYSPLQTGNRVLTTYQLEAPAWYNGDPRISDSPEMLSVQRQGIAELGLKLIDSELESSFRKLFQVPADAFDLDSLYPPVEWAPRD